MRNTLFSGQRIAGLLLVSLLLVGWAAAGPVAEDAPRVNINTASLEELQSLPGVGPAIAARIVEYRENNGPFERAVDLMNVKGIGERTFGNLKDRITVSRDGRK